VSQGVFITRQPVLNRQRAITANRLIVHARGASPGDAAAVALNAAGDAWPTERTVFLSLGGVMPDPGLLAWQVPPNAMIEIPAGALNALPTLQLMQALAGAGHALCLDGHVPVQALPPHAHFSFVLADAAAAPDRGAAAGLLLARGLDDAPAFDAALKAGFDGAAGWFFLRSKPVARKLIAAHAQIVRLLNLVRRNADLHDIEAVLKQDVTLSFKLLRYINSAGFGLSCEIQSFRHAVTILGYDRLNKWLALLLVTASKDPAAPALMQTAIARGRFMEGVGARFFDKQQLDNLFVAGAFSVLDVLLGVPFETILEEMKLPDAVSDALLRRDSMFKPFLDLALACEADSDQGLAVLADSLHLSAGEVNRALFQALSFADSLPAI
jgi:EAL and modified HD-GYP domain-containing signal transduction protein